MQRHNSSSQSKGSFGYSWYIQRIKGNSHQLTINIIGMILQDFLVQLLSLVILTEHLMQAGSVVFDGD